MKKGFTLVEIMIVVAIIALLAAIAIPNLLRARMNANDANAQAILRTLSTAAESFSAANGGIYPTDMANLTTAVPPYINEDYTDGAARQGYIFADDLGNTSYNFTANPAGCNTTGSRAFNITTGGVLNGVGC